MYRYSNGQISLADFKQPIGMNLKEFNRWVTKEQTIPWPEIEQRDAALFTNRKGDVAKPLRLELGACINHYPDEEVPLQIQENPYLRGYPGYDDSKPPFDSSLMMYFHKRLTPEVLGKINKMILSTARKEKPHNDDNNSGAMTTDQILANKTVTLTSEQYRYTVSAKVTDASVFADQTVEKNASSSDLMTSLGAIAAIKVSIGSNSLKCARCWALMVPSAIRRIT